MAKMGLSTTLTVALRICLSRSLSQSILYRSPGTASAPIREDLVSSEVGAGFTENTGSKPPVACTCGLHVLKLQPRDCFERTLLFDRGSFIDFPPALFSLSSLVLSQEMAQVAPCFQALILTHIFWEVAWQVTRRSRVSVDFSNESWLARLLYKVVL